jgi:hypothetical protein
MSCGNDTDKAEKTHSKQSDNNVEKHHKTRTHRSRNRVGREDEYFGLDGSRAESIVMGGMCLWDDTRAASKSCHVGVKAKRIEGGKSMVFGTRVVT